MNIQINTHNGTGHQIEIAFDHTRIQVEPSELRNLVQRTTKYLPALDNIIEADIQVKHQQQNHQHPAISEHNRQVNMAIDFIQSGILARLRYMDNGSTEKLSNSITMLSGNEVKEMLRRMSNQTLSLLFRHFRDIGDKEVEAKITDNMTSKEADQLKQNIGDYIGNISEEKAHEVIVETTEILYEMDRNGMIGWIPNVLRIGHSDRYQLIFKCTSIQLSGAEINLLLDQATHIVCSATK